MTRRAASAASQLAVALAAAAIVAIAADAVTGALTEVSHTRPCPPGRHLARNGLKLECQK